jgi:hypothetical protein
MRAVIVAHGEDLTLALREAQDVSNILQGGGHSAHLVVGDGATLECLGEALNHGPYDLAWVITHSGAEGFALADQTISPAQLGQWLDAARCWEAVLNSCFSAEHVATVQQAAHVDVVATIDPKGVDGRVARSTGVYLARALVETGDLQDACARASGNGAVQYRWFPAGSGLRQARGADSDLARKVDDLVVALTGNLSGQRGLIARMDELSADLKQYAAANEAWKREHEDRLRAVERRRGLFGIPLFF